MLVIPAIICNRTKEKNEDYSHSFIDASHKDAATTCNGYKNIISLPIVGKNVTVIGKWIADLEGSSGPYKWNEIHPVTRVLNAKTLLNLRNSIKAEI